VEKYRVLVVDDFAPWRRFLCSTLEQQRDDVEIVGESSDGWEAIQHAQALHPDLILLDIGLPTLDGIETARRLRRLSPCSKILFVSQDSSPEVIEEALRTGAEGYIIKVNASDLLTAVDNVLALQPQSS
jgi:DNA-binding NarL/FixJ family response regulator